MNNADENLALLLLDRLDVAADEEDRVDQIVGLVRGLASDRRTQAAEIARLSAALDEKTAQLEAERARNAWQPIETAPKDGTLVILAEGERVFRGQFVIMEYSETRDLDGRYIDHQDYEEFWMADDGDMPEPTHWQPQQPLPAPPLAIIPGAKP